VPPPEAPFWLMSPAVGRTCLFFCPVLLVEAARGFLLCAVAPPAGLEPGGVPPGACAFGRRGPRAAGLARPLVGGASGPLRGPP
jgi:hypothetical protein